jgi:hypothetical protein
MKDIRKVYDKVLASMKDEGNSALASIKDAGRTFHIILAILLVLMAWGLISWVRIMFIEGVGITGSSDLVPWGLYIVCFVFFVGTSAGASLRTPWYARHPGRVSVPAGSGALSCVRRWKSYKGGAASRCTPQSYFDARLYFDDVCGFCHAAAVRIVFCRKDHTNGRRRESFG